MWIVSAGIILRMMDFSPALSKHGGGLQVETLHIPSGVSAYAGPYRTLAGEAGFVVGLGWSVLAFEVDAFTKRDGFGARWFAKLRIPISVGAYALWRKRRVSAGRK